MARTDLKSIPLIKVSALSNEYDVKVPEIT